MALKWIEGFDAYSNVDDTSIGALLWKKGWNLDNIFGLNPSYYKIREGHWGDWCLRLSDDDNWVRTPVLTTDPTLIIGCSVKWLLMTNNDPGCIAFYNGNSLGINIRTNGAGTVKLYRGATFIKDFDVTVSPDTWYYLEIKCYCNDTTGYFEARLNRQVVCTYTGDTDNGVGYHDRVQWRGTYQVNYSFFVDDIYVCDGAGASHNDFLGVQRVKALFPSANGDQNDWTPSAGSNYECVDDPAPSLTDYVATSTPDAVDLYQYQDVEGIAGGIMGVQINTLAFSEADCVPWTMKDVCKSGATTQESGEKWASAGGGRFELTILTTDPNTGGSWSIAAVNSAQFGVKLISTDP